MMATRGNNNMDLAQPVRSGIGLLLLVIGVILIYSLITNYTKTECLEVTFMSSPFCGSGIWAQLSWVPWLRVSHKVTVELSSGLQSSQGSVREGSAASPAHEVVGLKASVSH